LAVLYASLGDKDSAFRSLQFACDRRLSRTLLRRVEPELEVLRSDPRFWKILNRMGLAR
jgi:hypothetical protein